MAFDSAHAIGWVCEQALQTGHAFARKFVGNPSKTIDGLRRCLRMAQKQPAGIHLLGGGYFKGKLLQGSRYRSAKRSASAARQQRVGKRATNRTSPNRTSSNRTSMVQRRTSMAQRQTDRKMDREWRGLTLSPDSRHPLPGARLAAAARLRAHKKSRASMGLAKSWRQGARRDQPPSKQSGKHG